MSKGTKIIIPILAFLFFALVVGYYLKSKGSDRSSTVNIPVQKSVSSTPKEKLPAPTGQVDDTVDAILKEANDETNLLSEELDTAKTIANSEEASDLSQIYEGNEF